MMLMAKKRTWIITIGDDRPIQNIAKDLTAAGLENVQILQEIGSITGSVEDKDVEKLRKVRGVVEISPESTIDIGPPNSRDTW